MLLTEQARQANPWPTHHEGSILFLLDARNRFERRVLSDWVDSHNTQQQTYLMYALPLLDQQLKIDSALIKLIENAPNSTLIVPLRLAWSPSSKAIESGPRLADLLLGDPRRPKSWRGKRLLINKPERVAFLVGSPDTLHNLKSRFAKIIEEEDQTATALAEFIASQAALVLDIAERKLQGGRYKVPRFVASNLRNRRRYKQALISAAEETGQSLALTAREADSYLKEMISKPNTFWLDFYAKFNQYCLGLAYEDDVVVNSDSMEKLRAQVRDYPSILLWTHKTYLDGMVVPKVLYEHDFPMPHMFGGANLSFAGLGFLLRRAGGIFIRRSFQDNPTYKAILRQYIGYLMEKRFPMNWSFEGTRSRLGKLMPPKYGLLKYVLEAAHSTDARDIHIVPISISYDLIRDVEEYATEQAGRSKKAESLMWFIGYVKSLARPMGRVYMNIGNPVILPTAPDPDDKLALAKIAFEVAVEANKVTPITFPALISMCLLGSAPRALTEQEVVTELQELVIWAQQRKILLSDDLQKDINANLDGVLGLMIAERIITRYDAGPETVYGIEQSQHPIASYYRNSIIHFFVHQAIIELAVVKIKDQTGPKAVKTFWSEVDALKDHFKFEFFYPPTEVFHKDVETELNQHFPDALEQLNRENITGEAILRSITPLVAHRTLLSFAEAYSIVTDVTCQPTNTELEIQSVTDQALKLGKQAYLQRRISSESSIAKLLFQNCYQLLQHRGLHEFSGPQTHDERRQLAIEFRDILKRLDTIRAMALAKTLQ